MRATYIPPKFDNAVQRDFTRTLMKRVDDYFRSNKVSRNANFNLYFKTFVVFAMYFVPYAVIMSQLVGSSLGVLGLYIVQGFGIACIGLCVMHDANHGAYSNKKWVNSLLSYSLNVIGGSSTNWRVQHNYKHHTYTNVEGHDDDIAPVGMLRFSPHSKFKPVHKYQHLYAWFFYGLMTISWVFMKDYKELVIYHRDGLLDKVKADFRKELVIMILSKVVYMAYMLVLPLWLTDYSPGLIIGGFFLMHFIAGMSLALIFQPAHVLEDNEFLELDESHKINDSWFAHQLKTTADFAHRNKLFSWFIGGLNYQVEHHLFPSIAHVHYPKIAPIVKETAEEFGLPYHSFRTFRGAVKAHFKMLKNLGDPTIGERYRQAS